MWCPVKGAESVTVMVLQGALVPPVTLTGGEGSVGVGWEEGDKEEDFKK